MKSNINAQQHPVYDRCQSRLIALYYKSFIGADTADTDNDNFAPVHEDLSKTVSSCWL